jgi:hypothetical protein
LYVKDLYVKGSTTTIDSNTVNIGDNIINLNGDMLSTSTPTEDSGILINRGNSTSAMLYWREATDKWVAGLSGSEQPIILSVTGEDITFTGNRYLKSNINTDVLNIGDSTKQGYIMLPGTNAGWVDDGGVLITSRYDSSVASAGTIRLRTYDGTNVYDWMSMDKDGNFSFNGPIVNIPTGKLGFNSGTTSGTAGIANSDTGYIYGEHDSGVENSRLVIEVGDNTNDAIVFRTLSGATKKDQMTINFDSISFATRPTFASNTAWDAGNLPNPAQTTGFTMTGDINLANARIIFNDVVASNKDYIWADDSNNEFNFVFDSSLGVAGNATLVAKNVKTSGDNSFSGENYHYSGKGSTYKNSDNTKSVRMAYNDAFNSLDIVFQ